MNGPTTSTTYSSLFFLFKNWIFSVACRLPISSSTQRQDFPFPNSPLCQRFTLISCKIPKTPVLALFSGIISDDSCIPEKVSSSMSHVASSPLGLHRLGHCSRNLQSPVLVRVNTSTQSFARRRSRRFVSVACQTNPNPTEEASATEKLLDEPSSPDGSSKQAVSSSSDDGLPQLPNKDLNRQIAAVSTLAAVALFFSTRLDFGVSLKDLSATALPYEEALSNGKPTVVEFYADWCEVCRELAPDVYKVEQRYRDRVNFVMLNVDNTKWEQELDEFGVEGIPHFAFLDKEGNEEGNVVGRLPRQYLLENVDALARGESTVPHARVVGQYSSAEARRVHQVVDPRSHG